MLKRKNKEGKKEPEGQEEENARLCEESAAVWGSEGAGHTCRVGGRPPVGIWERGASVVFTSN